MFDRAVFLVGYAVHTMHIICTYYALWYTYYAYYAHANVNLDMTSKQWNSKVMLQLSTFLLIGK